MKTIDHLLSTNLLPIKRMATKTELISPLVCRRLLPTCRLILRLVDEFLLAGEGTFRCLGEMMHFMKIAALHCLHRITEPPILLVAFLLAFVPSAHTAENPPNCSLAHGGLGATSLGGITLSFSQAHVGDVVAVSANLGMVTDACQAINATGSLWIATGKLTDFLINVTLNPGTIYSCPGTGPCQPGPYNVEITPELVGLGVSTPLSFDPGVAGEVRVVEIGQGSVQSGNAPEPLADRHSATLIIVTPCIQVIKQCAFPPGSDFFPPGVPVHFTGSVSNCGDIRLTNVVVSDSRAAQLYDIGGLPLVQPMGLNPGETVAFQGSYSPTSVDILAGFAASITTAVGTDTTTIGGPNASVMGSATIFCSLVRPPPTLRIAAAGNQSVLFWPTFAANYDLQSITNLASTNWTPVADALPVNAATITNSLPARFFRLVPRQGPITLSDGNTTAYIGPASQAGMYFWAVSTSTCSNQNQLNQQWFWYRVGDIGPERSIDTLSAPLVTQSASNVVTLSYSDTVTNLSRFQISITYSLVGGSPASGRASMSEQIRVNNTSGAVLPFHFFQNSDFNMGGDPANDANATSGNGITFGFNQANQFDGSNTVEVVYTPNANHAESDLASSTIKGLNDGVPTTLEDTTNSFGNVAWTFQWDKNIASGGSFIINSAQSLNVAFNGTNGCPQQAAVPKAGLEKHVALDSPKSSN